MDKTSTTVVKDKEIEAKSHSKTTYYNFIFFQISDQILFGLVYLIASVLLNLINRFIYLKYNFKFNFTLILIQQISTCICFNTIFTKFKNFNQIVGKTNFNEFSNKFVHISVFCLFFILNIICSFIGNQRVSTAMFLCIRKFLLIMNYLYDRFINKKTFPSFFTQSVFLIVFGSLLSGVFKIFK